MFLESWVQIVLQIINNEKAVDSDGNPVNGWDALAIQALIASLCVFVLNALQFVYALLTVPPLGVQLGENRPFVLDVGYRFAGVV